MSKRELKFTALEENYGGVLPLEDVHYFYYDICFDSEMGYSRSYEWNNEIQKFLDEKNIKIEALEENSIPHTFENNAIYFSYIKKDRDNKASALFRHLRNAFSHYEVGFNDNFYNMKDFRYDEKKKLLVTTMIGKIEVGLFKQLIAFFFNQKTVIENDYNRYLSPEI